jgi:hypothetical protein
MAEEKSIEDLKDLRALDDALIILRSRFTNVQVFATRDEGDRGTLRFTRGVGDYYSRFGVCKMWVDSQMICVHSDEGEE